MRYVLLALALAACARPAARHYYTLTPGTPATHFEKPYPVTLKVRELEMSRSYRRDELVIRSDANELTFSRVRRWSEPPQRMISALLREQVRGSNIATSVYDDTAAAEPDYVLGGEIEAIEQINVGRDRYAHLAVTLRLTRVKDDAAVWRYHIDAKQPVAGAATRGTVRALSEVMTLETDKALVDLGGWFADPDAPRIAELEAATAPPPPAEEEGVVGPEVATTMRHILQLQRDDTPLPPGMGALFAPTLSDGNREPRAVVSQGKKTVAEGKLGERIVLAPGVYELRVGSGAISQQLVTRVRVVAGKTTVVPASWGALEVAVVDETYVPFRGTYEIIRMANREDFGIGFGADEQIGEETRVWVLPPGLYKVIRAGGTYRDRTDFATVRLEAGKQTRLTLVQDPVSGTFRGAGEDDPDLTDLAGGPDDEDKSPFTLRAIVGGDLNFNRSDLVGDQQGWKLAFRVFFDGSFRVSDGPHNWFTRLELEEGQTRLLAQKRFQNDTDRLYLNTIYTYRIFPWFGPYARVGGETKLLPRHEDFDAPREIEEVDEAGNVIDTRTVSRVRLGGTFAPLQLKEGIGGNFRVLRSQAVELDLRLGWGARQTLANGLRVFEEGTPGRLVPVVDSTLMGLETTLVGLGRITRYLTLTTELDGLVPVGGDAVVFTWRSQATLRLASFMSLVYRFNVVRDPNLGIGTDPRTEHDVQLRFSYVIF